MHETGGLKWCAAAGVAAGLAVGFKYTAGLVLLAPALALVLPLAAGAQTRAALRAAALGGLVVGAGALLAFLVTNPYFSSTSTPRCTSCAARPSWPATRTSSARSATPASCTTSTA